jgi:hypothetical protein
VSCPCGSTCACHTNGAYPPPCDYPGGCGTVAVPECAATGCPGPPAAGAMLCAPDITSLGDWIAKIGQEYTRLSATPSTQARQPGTGRGGGLASHRNPALLDVLVLRDPRSKERSEHDRDGNTMLGVYEVLHAFAEDIREGRDLSQPTIAVPACPHPCLHKACLLGIGHAVRVPLTVATERAIIATHLQWAVAQEWAGDMFDQVRTVWNQLQAALGDVGRARASCDCGGKVTWSNGTARCGACGTKTTGLDVVRKHSGSAA